ncbi:MAG: tetratricopeptide repeat protein [Promethearchaeota archaeon]
MLNSNSKELTRAKQLINECKLQEALLLVNEFRKKKALSRNEQISYYLLKSSLSLYLFQEQGIFEYAEKAYQESQKLGISIQLVDVYIQMAMGLIFRFKSEETLGFIVKAEDLIKMLTEEPPTELLERKASIAFIKAWLYSDQNEKDKGLEWAQQGLEIREEIDLKAGIGISLWQIAWIYFRSDNELALKYVDRCIKFCEKINYKNLNQKCNMLKGLVYLWKGELAYALKYFNLSKKLLEELPRVNKDSFSAAQLFHLIGSVYRDKNELDIAKEYFERALVIKEKVGAYFAKVLTLDELMSLSLYKSDLKEAEKYLKEMKEISDQENNKYLNLCYRVNMARLLKLSPLISSRAKAEEILKESLDDKVADNEVKIITLLNLTDLLLAKLDKTNDLKVLDEIQLYTTQLHDIAKSQNSYSFLAETYLLRAKLELLTLNLKQSQRFLDEAQDIAEIYGLNLLLRRILIEQDNLVNQTENWERLKRMKANIAELINLAHIEEQLNHMMRKRFLLKNVV